MQRPHPAGASDALRPAVAVQHIRRWRGDDAGATFLLAGLLLVLGFVTLGATLHATSDVGEDTSRDQRDGLTTPVQNILQEFNRTVGQATSLGDTNVTGFLQRLERVEAQARTQASREGIYLDLEPVAEPDPALFQRLSRCIAHDPVLSSDGVIVGYETLEGVETIAGVVYHVQASDGKESLDIQLYVRINQCLPTQLTMQFDGLDVNLGTATDEEAAKKADDADAAVSLAESPQGVQVLRYAGPADEDSMDHYGWSDPHGIFADGGLSATHPATPLSDWMRFSFDTSSMPTDIALTNATLRYDGYETNVYDDYMEITVIADGTVIWMEVANMTETEQTYLRPLGLPPSGNLTWSIQEAGSIELLIKIIEVDKFDPPAFFSVDHATVEFDIIVPERHVLDVGVDYPKIPAIYDTHTLELRYNYSTGTHPEEVYVEFLDTATDTWHTRITLNDTADAWVTEVYAVASSEIDNGYIEMRIVDAGRNDWHPAADNDLQIDYLLLHSEFTT